MPTNLYGPGDNFDLEKSHALPALVRKMHLARLLVENDMQGVMADLGVRSEAEVDSILTHYSVSAESVRIWGTGRPRREFLWSEDMADACVFLMEQRDFVETYPPATEEIRNTHINIGSGEDITIAELAELVKRAVGFNGRLVFDDTKPDGTLDKLADVGKLHGMGWRHKVELSDGVASLYEWYRKNAQAAAIDLQ
jgi:GDP-L-fucose synthase